MLQTVKNSSPIGVGELGFITVLNRQTTLLLMESPVFPTGFKDKL
jgi:hypothetical protein